MLFFKFKINWDCLPFHVQQGSTLSLIPPRLHGTSPAINNDFKALTRPAPGVSRRHFPDHYIPGQEPKTGAHTGGTVCCRTMRRPKQKQVPVWITNSPRGDGGGGGGSIDHRYCRLIRTLLLNAPPRLCSRTKSRI